jgi:signal transduction histidine kinase
VWDGTSADLGIEMFSSTNNLTTETWLNISGPAPKAADQAFKPYLTHRQTWPMYGQKFSLFFYTTPLFEAQSPRRLAKIAIAAGTVLTLLATALVGVAQRARNRQELLTEQIREARDALAAAQEERNQFNRDLHDGTIQSLYAIQLGLEQTVERFEADPAKAGRKLSAVRRELDTVIAEIRQFITADVGAENPVDFSTVLQALTSRARTGTSAQIVLSCEPGAADRLVAAQAVQLANIAREALSNSLRHARPQRVQISLRAERDSAILQISDDGVGFDPMAATRPGVGLASMSSRAQELGGMIDIQSAAGQGTCIVVRVPFAPSELTEEEPPSTASEEM